ncbi:unnamed protein product [Thelazia callipaeda]|uniref:RGS domain-containing protein n=1 Tax=Thelazia callipaeda TaxID=103827 RepID=A0A0N5CM45_THECL|nr:unnamed protein product [Thelazia callipaeda]
MDECSNVLWNCLEDVLEDAAALESFKEWFRDGRSTKIVDSIDLYFAIKAFKNLSQRNDPKCTEIACKIHRKYISMRSGTCIFLPDETRKEMSVRIHALSASKVPRENLFEPCLHEVLEYLRKQYAIFVNSNHFCNLVNQNAEVKETPVVFIGNENDEMTCSMGCCHTCASTSAESVLRSANHSSVWKKWKAPRRSTAVQNVSKRDSGDSVSCSAASGEDVGNKQCNWKRRSERLFSQRVHGLQQDQVFYTCPPDGSDFKHQRPEERERFSEILCYKLNKILSRLEQHKRETGNEIYARDLKHLSTTAEKIDEADSIISDDSLDKYEQRMNAEWDTNPKEDRRRSQSASPVRWTSTFHVTNLSNPYGRNGFAPPPGVITALKDYASCAQNPGFHSLRSTTPLSNNEYGGHRYSDSSGFCSSESANVVNRAALFEKARHMAMSTQNTSFSQCKSRTCSEVSSNSFYYCSCPYEQKQRLFTDNIGGNFCPQQQYLTVSYKEEHAEAPFVAKLEMRDITFREFRRCFGISSKTTKSVMRIESFSSRFFFKSDCEDCSAPYQWTIVDDDCTVLPVFEGRITAECRSCSDFD